MLLENPIDFRETFLEFTTQGLLSLTRFGPELRSGRWYFRVDSLRQKQFTLRVQEGLPYSQYLLYEFLTVVVFSIVVLTILGVVFAWFVWSQPESDDTELEREQERLKIADANARQREPSSSSSSLLDHRHQRSSSEATTSTTTSPSFNNAPPLSESQERAKLEDDVYHPLEFSMRGNAESIKEYEARLTPFERNCLRYVWRYRQYIGNTMLLGMFFGIPALQVITQEMDMLNTGDRNLCYFNELCMRPHTFGKGEGTFQMMAWNNVYSNVGYLIVGVLFMLYIVAVQLWRTRRGRQYVRLVPRDFSFGWAMGIGIVWEGIFSAMYHLCPTTVIFQVDTVFMFTIAILCFVELFRKRFGWVWSAWRTFVAVAVLLLINYLGTIAAQLETRTYEDIFLFFMFMLNTSGFLAGTVYTIYRIRNKRTVLYNWFWGYYTIITIIMLSLARYLLSSSLTHSFMWILDSYRWHS